MELLMAGRFGCIAPFSQRGHKSAHKKVNSKEIERERGGISRYSVSHLHSAASSSFYKKKKRRGERRRRKKISVIPGDV